MIRTLDHPPIILTDAFARATLHAPHHHAQCRLCWPWQIQDGLAFILDKLHLGLEINVAIEEIWDRIGPRVLELLEAHIIGHGKWPWDSGVSHHIQ